MGAIIIEVNIDHFDEIECKKMKSFDFLIFFLAASLTHASDINVRTGGWSFQSKAFADNALITLDFNLLKTEVMLSSGNSKVGIFKLNGASFVADFGFGEGHYFLSQTDELFFICSQKNKNDCLKLEPEN